MRFSSRVPHRLAANRLATALAGVRASGAPIIDLTESNPTRAGITYPSGALASLGRDEAIGYDPAPFGQPDAREAVADELAVHRGVRPDPGRIVLTASTSEAYSLLFKLLCDPGDDVLVPAPSYPLFEHLTRLEGIEARPYPLEHHGAWRIDHEALVSARTPRTRLVLVVNPNNPTGSYLKRDELERITALCARQDLALLGDEVFWEYPMAADAERASVLGQDEALAFSLGGLSKLAGLPQVKLAWIAAGGPHALVTAALERLEVICDTYLSVSSPVQRAAASLLAQGRATRAQIADRVRGNLRALESLMSEAPACRLLGPEGGWYAVLQVPALESEEDLVLDLLRQDGVLVHPGYFFDFPTEAFLVLSLLPPPPAFTEGARRVLARTRR